MDSRRVEADRSRAEAWKQSARVDEQRAREQLQQWRKEKMSSSEGSPSINSLFEYPESRRNQAGARWWKRGPRRVEQSRQRGRGRGSGGRPRSQRMNAARFREGGRRNNRRAVFGRGAGPRKGTLFAHGFRTRKSSREQDRSAVQEAVRVAENAKAEMEEMQRRVATHRKQVDAHFVEPDEEDGDMRSQDDFESGGLGAKSESSPSEGDAALGDADARTGGAETEAARRDLRQRIASSRAAADRYERILENLASDGDESGDSTRESGQQVSSDRTSDGASVRAGEGSVSADADEVGGDDPPSGGGGSVGGNLDALEGQLPLRTGAWREGPERTGSSESTERPAGLGRSSDTDPPEAQLLKQPREGWTMQIGRRAGLGGRNRRRSCGRWTPTWRCWGRCFCQGNPASRCLRCRC